MAEAAPRDYVGAVYGSQIVFLVLSVVAVALRLWARRVDRVGLGATDYTILIALAMLVAICSTNIWAAAAGILGVSFGAISPDQLVSLKKLIFISTIFNFFALGMVKISIALFYQVLFFIKPTFTRVVNVYMVVTVMWTIAAIFLVVFCIKPIEAVWLPMQRTERVNVRQFLIIVTAVDIVLDVTILCMPLFALGSLNLSLRRKIQAGGIFALGFLVCVGSALHLYYIIKLDDAKYLASVEVNAGNFITASLETAGSIVTACLPTLAPLFRSKSRFSSPFRSARSRASPGGGQSSWGNRSEETTEVSRHSIYDVMSGAQPTDTKQPSSSIVVHGPSSKDIEAQQSGKGCIVTERSFSLEDDIENATTRHWSSVGK